MRRYARSATLAATVIVALAAGGCAPTDTPAPPPPAASSPTPETSAPQGAQTSGGQAVVVDDDLSSLEAAYDARVGVYALDTGSGDRVAYRADERFAYASSIKAVLAAAILQEVDDLDRVVSYGADALVANSPETEANLATGMSIRDLAEAAVRVSDNAATNLLLAELGGPAAFGELLASLGDTTTEPARTEPALNEATPGDTRDTSTPRALVETLRAYALGDALPDDRRALLIDWMTGNATGDTLIRAGAPADAVVADKSGAGGYGTRTDIAVVWPAEGDPIVIAVLSSRAEAGAERDDQLVADAAAVALDALEGARQ
ncbi:beta-lactamase class A [Microcella putealis]|uniref:Beta-lactamase class A n=1 Tax=Microcella putealis TaxID=337005 RepID=A0A4Q7LTV8_9MICO|nr:class A beta-lactamase [Microcella putealis]RZS57753.1 beta-lactamase class A [Microcella putealis]TQM24820.1 beta-lactamase class A [Microcella putealis]